MKSQIEKPGVSVIIPVHNRAHCIERALQSVLQQSMPPDQIILVDDGSTDALASVVAQYPAVELIQQAHAGVSAARNCGIAAARHEWIALLDSDDTWQPQKLERQLEALHSNPEYKLCHTDEIWIRNGVRVNQMKKHQKAGGWIFEKCLPLCAISPSASLIHRSLFAEVGLFDETLPACEDYDLWLRISARYPVLFVDEMLTVKYGGHDDQLSRKHWGMDRFRVRAMLKLLDSGELDQRQRRLVLTQLQKKLRILINGAEKRAQWSDVDHYQRIMRQVVM
jgi:glycosyltransferase involved in cell wall biosynthesis